MDQVGPRGRCSFKKLRPPPAALIVLRPVGSGGNHGPMALLDFGRSVKPISTMGQIKPPALILGP